MPIKMNEQLVIAAATVNRARNLDQYAKALGRLFEVWNVLAPATSIHDDDTVMSLRLAGFELYDRAAFANDMADAADVWSYDKDRQLVTEDGILKIVPRTDEPVSANEWDDHE